MLLLILFAVTFLFAFVLLVGAPYLPTRQAQARAALDLLALKPGQTFYELGCGDGRVLKQAAERGYTAVGYELNPLLVIVARIYTWQYRKSVKVKWGSFWKADLQKADGVFVFLLDRFMERLDVKMKQEVRPGVRLASFAFKIPGKKIIEERAGIYLYEY